MGQSSLDTMALFGYQISPMYAFDDVGIEIPFPHFTLYAGQFKDGFKPTF